MVSAITNTLAGLQTAGKKLDEAANKIANVTTPGSDGDLITPSIDLKLAEVQYKANLKALEAERDISEQTLHLFDKKV